MVSKQKTVVLVGLMGAGKTRVGIALAKVLRLDFIDADREIEKAAGMSVADIFDILGEEAFRDGEQKVMQRLLAAAPCVIATGGGAFMQPSVRAAIDGRAVSVWLKAGLETLVARTERTDHRPLLQGASRAEKLEALMEERYPVYAMADITVDTDGKAPMEMARMIADAVAGILP